VSAAFVPSGSAAPPGGAAFGPLAIGVVVLMTANAPLTRGPHGARHRRDR
jgi:hypothetical protein